MTRLSQTEFDNERQVYTFDIVSGSGEPVGMAQLRLKPSKGTDMPDGFESHIYYEVSEKHRGKGYATAALKELIKTAAKHNVNPLIATVNYSNAASITVIKKCGGRLADEAMTAKGQKVQKYYIQTAG